MGRKPLHGQGEHENPRRALRRCAPAGVPRPKCLDHWRRPGPNRRRAPPQCRKWLIAARWIAAALDREAESSGRPKRDDFIVEICRSIRQGLAYVFLLQLRKLGPELAAVGVLPH